MSQCPNCNQKLSCGCQKRNASNGTQVCTNCLGGYESKIKNINQSSVTTEEETEPIVHRRGQPLRKFTK